MGVAAILVMWPASCHQIFISLYLKANIQNLVKNGPVDFLEKNKTTNKQVLIFICKCPGSKVKRWPWPSILTIPFINSIRCLLPTNLQVGCNTFWKIHCFKLFPMEKPKLQNLTLPKTRSKVNPGSSFEQIMMGWSPRCYIPSFVEIGSSVLEKIFEGFFYMGVAAIFVMWPRCREQTFVPPYPRRLHIKFDFDPPSGFWEDDV